jgi:hypothetical protein
MPSEVKVLPLVFDSILLVPLVPCPIAILEVDDGPVPVSVLEVIRKNAVVLLPSRSVAG